MFNCQCFPQNYTALNTFLLTFKLQFNLFILETENTMTYYSPIDRRNGPVTSGQTPYMRAQAFETRYLHR